MISGRDCCASYWTGFHIAVYIAGEDKFSIWHRQLNHLTSSSRHNKLVAGCVWRVQAYTRHRNHACVWQLTVGLTWPPETTDILDASTRVAWSLSWRRPGKYAIKWGVGTSFEVGMWVTGCVARRLEFKIQRVWVRMRDAQRGPGIGLSRV